MRPVVGISWSYFCIFKTTPSKIYINISGDLNIRKTLVYHQQNRFALSALAGIMGKTLSNQSSVIGLTHSITHSFAHTNTTTNTHAHTYCITHALTHFIWAKLRLSGPRGRQGQTGHGAHIRQQLSRVLAAAHVAGEADLQARGGGAQSHALG